MRPGTEIKPYHYRKCISSACGRSGYIIAKAQSGYYVTDIATKQHPVILEKHSENMVPCLYDFASSGVDRESYRFDLWQRYIKSALRQDNRMLSYGEPQGEKDLREVLSDYIRERRNVICSPDDIVVGAGLQSLLQILCPLIRERKTVSFPTRHLSRAVLILKITDLMSITGTKTAM